MQLLTQLCCSAVGCSGAQQASVVVRKTCNFRQPQSVQQLVCCVTPRQDPQQIVRHLPGMLACARASLLAASAHAGLHNTL